MKKIAYIFPGQGSQYVGMGKDFYETSPAAKRVFDEADDILEMPLRELIFSGNEEELTKTSNAQPALLVMSMACLAAAREAERIPEPDYMAGHSLGEYSALAAAGSMDFSTALRLVRERGLLMQEAGTKTPGGMAAVIGCRREILEQICAETGAYAANFNCPGQIVISGSPECVRAASALARKRGAKMAIPLKVSGPFHTPLMAEAQKTLAGLIEKAEIHDPRVPVVANSTAEVLTSAEDVRKELTGQVIKSVLWEESIRKMLENGVSDFYEIGPGQVLTGLNRRICPDAETFVIGTREDL